MLKSKKGITYIGIIIVFFVAFCLVFKIINAALSPGSGVGSDLFGYGEAVASLIAAFLIVSQLQAETEAEKSENLIQQCIFVKDFNQAFIENENMTNVEFQLEAYYTAFCALEDIKVAGKTGNDPEYLEAKINLEKAQGDLETAFGVPGSPKRQKFVNYLVYLEGLATVMLVKGMDYDLIDSLLGYRFFLAVNNPVIQNGELIPFAVHYRGIYELYAEWIDHRIKMTARTASLGDSGYTIPNYDRYGVPMQGTDHAFDQTGDYEKMIQYISAIKDKQNHKTTK